MDNKIKCPYCGKELVYDKLFLKYDITNDIICKECGNLCEVYFDKKIKIQKRWKENIKK